MTQKEQLEEEIKNLQEQLSAKKKILEYLDKSEVPKIYIRIYDSHGNKLDDSGNDNIVTYYANYTGDFMLAPCILYQDNTKNNIYYHTNLTIRSNHPVYPKAYAYWYGTESYVDTDKEKEKTDSVINTFNGRSPTGLSLNFRNVIIYKE